MGKKRIPQNNNKGEWEGEKGNSKYIFNKDFKPSSNNYGNDSDNPKTIGQMGEELGDLSPAVEFKNNYPIFNRDGGTFNGKPLEIYFDNGFIPYLNQDEIKRNEGKKVNREKLHTEAFKRLADKYEMTQDTIRIFKGDSAPVESLANKWNCSKEEVWKKCKNPYKIQRVLHECEDGKTIQLVPRLYHNNIVHTGGIEMIVNKILCTES